MSKLKGPLRDTIAAVATAPGRGGVGVVRVSGSLATSIAGAVIGRLPNPRVATVAKFLDVDGDVIDHGIALYFAGPKSFTGEDVVEFQGHGSPVALDRLLERVCATGARLARPGEFTERAFLNDKMDLAQAEAVADLVNSASRRAAKSAMRSLQGEFSDQVKAIDRRVLDLRVYLEAAIDFAEEEIDFLAESDVVSRLTSVGDEIEDLLAQSRRGQVLRDGFDVVIAGAPNAGKSSLLNLLLAENRAIVTAVPGTTRDLLVADVDIAGIPVRLTDTAGFRDVGADPVEAIGIARAEAAAGRADLVLLVVDDATDEESPIVHSDWEDVLLVRNKIDLTGRTPGPLSDDGEPSTGEPTGTRLASTAPFGGESEETVRNGLSPEERCGRVEADRVDLSRVNTKHLGRAVAARVRDGALGNEGRSSHGDPMPPVNPPARPAVARSVSVLAISAKTGAGVDSLRTMIALRANLEAGEGAYLARKRHLVALATAKGHVLRAVEVANDGYGDLAAEELRGAHHALGEIVGAKSVDDLLGEIFSSFCIGK